LRIRAMVRAKRAMTMAMKKAIASNDDDGDKYNDDDHDSNDGRDNNSNQEK
jgi:hypothetical protein